MLNTFFIWTLHISQGLGYLGVGILMVVESSFLPFPSEIIVPPAAYLASQGQMNILIIFIVAVLGSLLGAIINYVLAVYLGRPLIYRFAHTKLAHILLISPEKIKQSEEYFLANSNSATFLGRLIPVVRQLISLPAGFSRMPFGRFVVLTTLGASLWVAILAGLGYFIGANQVLLSKYYREISAALLLLGVAWLGVKMIKYRSDGS